MEDSILEEKTQIPLPDVFEFFEKFKTNKTENEQKEIIKKSIKNFLKLHPGIKPTNTLILVVHQILTDMFINKVRFIAIEAPTGSGKSVIGYCLAETFNYCMYNIFNCENGTSYLLTSSKMLQKQIQNDFKRFDFDENYAMLKGTANYPCTYYYYEALNAEMQKNKLLGKAASALTNTVKPDKSLITTYDKRPCISFSPQRRNELPCFSTCQYIIKRAKASQSMCANLNYAYFLTVINSNANAKMYFDKRFLTICDEAHLIPDIVCNIFQYEISPMMIRKIHHILNSIFESLPDDLALYDFSYSKEDNEYIYEKLISYLEEAKNKDNLFLRRNAKFEEILEYILWCNSFYNDFSEILEEHNPTPEFADLCKIYLYSQVENDDDISQKEKMSNIYFDLKKLGNRPEDIFIRFEDTGKYGKYIIKDLSEQELVRNKLLSKCYFGIFISATLGNTDQFGELLGIKKEQYKSYRMDPTFDYSTSPIYKCNVGSLTQKNFSSNIDNCLDAVIYICHNIHPDEKGIIHTATFNITELLKEKIIHYMMKGDGGKFPGLQLSRFRFYKTPQEKDNCIEELKKSELPLVIVGPSLYEGLDLKYDEGRFNILIKVPYPALDDYIKAKMKRIDFWYERVTLEKIIQAIGRTNRAVDDSSKTYLIDTTFSWLIPKMFGSKIQERIKSMYLDVPEKSEKPKKMYSFDDIKNIKNKEDNFDDIWNDNDDDLPF